MESTLIAWLVPKLGYDLASLPAYVVVLVWVGCFIIAASVPIIVRRMTILGPVTRDRERVKLLLDYGYEPLQAIQQIVNPPVAQLRALTDYYIEMGKDPMEALDAARSDLFDSPMSRRPQGGASHDASCLGGLDCYCFDATKAKSVRKSRRNRTSNDD
jgi:hypothetical protein